MREYGNVSIPQEAFIAALRMGEAYIRPELARGGGPSDGRGRGIARRHKAPKDAGGRQATSGQDCNVSIPQASAL